MQPNVVTYEVDGTMFVPIPPDASDAYALYRDSPVFECAVDEATDSEAAVRILLSDGPSCISIERERLGLPPL